MTQPTVRDVLESLAQRAIDEGLDPKETIGLLQKTVQERIGLSPRELSEMQAVPWEAVKSRQSVQPAEPAAHSSCPGSRQV